MQNRFPAKTLYWWSELFCPCGKLAQKKDLTPSANF